MRSGELRRIAYERQQGRCGATGVALGDPDGPWHMHHRLAGGMGGSGRDRDVPSNVIALLGPAHNMGSPGLVVDGVPGRSVHGDPGWSRPLGLLLSQSRLDDPAAMPVRLAGMGWGFLLDDGGWQPIG